MTDDTVTAPQHGSFVWNELNSHDPEKAKAFYGQLMGWSFAPFPMAAGTYWIIRSGDKDIGGIFPLAGPDFAGIPPHWLIYIGVDDVDARVEEAKAVGGAVARAPFDVPGVGRIAIVQDAEGAYMGWITPKM